MALWHRVRPARVALLSRPRARWHSASRSAVASRAGVQSLLNPFKNPLALSPARPTPGLFEYTPVRSFAAPVQAKPKPKTAAYASDEPRMNEAITAPLVRLVTDEGHGIVSRREALDRAMKLNLDLVEVQRSASPPVCKILDYHKEKFKQEVKEKERAKSKAALSLRNGENKEVRFKAKTELKDLKMKAETVTRLMERGYRVKCTAMPTGNEDEDSGGLLSRLLALIEDVSVVESGPHVDATKAYAIVRHVKFTTKKSGKKVSKVLDNVSKGLQSAVPTMSEVANIARQDEMALEDGEEWEQVESNSDAESDVPSASTEAAHDGASKEGFSGFSATDGSRSIFDFDANSDKKNDGYGGKMNGSMPLPQRLPNTSSIGRSDLNRRPPAFKPGFESPKAKQESQTEQTGKRMDTGFVSSQPVPSIVENNRYSRQLKVPLNQGRMPQQPLRNVRESQGLSDLKPGQPHPDTPSSPSPSSRIFSSPRAAGFGDQRNLGGTTIDRPTNPASPAPRFGNFIAQKNAAESGNQINLRGANLGKPSDSSSPTPSYGIFSRSRTIPSSEEGSQGEATTGKPLNRSTPSSKYGIFSATKPSASGDQKDLRNVNVGKPSDSSSPTPRYGIFSTPKSVTSSDQRN